MKGKNYLFAGLLYVGAVFALYGTKPVVDEKAYQAIKRLSYTAQTLQKKTGQKTSMEQIRIAAMQGK